MNRSDFQFLAVERVQDAKVLIKAGRWAAAYYLLGYAVECALKACVAKRFRQDEVPEKALVNDFYTHRLEKLLELAELQQSMRLAVEDDELLRSHWGTVCGWSETTRYSSVVAEAKAHAMLTAVEDTQSGVLTWLKHHY